MIMGDYDCTELDLLVNFPLFTNVQAVVWIASLAMHPPNHSLLHVIFKHHFGKQLFYAMYTIYQIKSVGARKQMINMCKIVKQLNEK